MSDDFEDVLHAVRLVGAPRTGDPRIHLAPIHRFGMPIAPLP